jgi:hypothetical protein
MVVGARVDVGSGVEVGTAVAVGTGVLVAPMEIETGPAVKLHAVRIKTINNKVIFFNCSLLES